MQAPEALARLREGNRRFVSDIQPSTSLTDRSRRDQLVAGQEPFAIVLGCSDSRVPAEIIFDQGLGDLFVIRVAGNIVAPSLVGSVEFAAEKFGTRLVVVVGHSGCSAIQATLQTLRHGADPPSPNVRSIVDRIRPGLAHLSVPASGQLPDSLVRSAVRANIRASAAALRHGSEILERLIAEDGLVVIGAEYALETGIVDFFDGTPGGSEAAGALRERSSR